MAQTSQRIGKSWTEACVIPRIKLPPNNLTLEKRNLLVQSRPIFSSRWDVGQLGSGNSIVRHARWEFKDDLIIATPSHARDWKPRAHERHASSPIKSPHTLKLSQRPPRHLTLLLRNRRRPVRRRRLHFAPAAPEPRHTVQLIAQSAKRRGSVQKRLILPLPGKRKAAPAWACHVRRARGL